VFEGELEILDYSRVHSMYGCVQIILFIQQDLNGGKELELCVNMCCEVELCRFMKDNELEV
jgi:hypothetical protein